MWRGLPAIQWLTSRTLGRAGPKSLAMHHRVAAVAALLWNDYSEVHMAPNVICSLSTGWVSTFVLHAGLHYQAPRVNHSFTVLEARIPRVRRRLTELQAVFLLHLSVVTPL